MANRIDFGEFGPVGGSGGGLAPSDIRGLNSLAPALTRLNGMQLLSGDDSRLRWQAGERLDHVFAQAALRFGDSDAVVFETTTVSYRDLERRANQVARYLIEQGVAPGDRVGLLFDKCVETYVAMLAVMKANAAYVPLDLGFPNDRIGFILADAGIKTIVSMSELRERVAALDARHLLLDAAKAAIDMQPCAPLADGEVGARADQVCYLIYTSGTTGNPKGVVIEHPSICNFVRVAAERYGFGPGDRIFQGMTIAFDFSVEEIWVPLMAGATLVPSPAGVKLLGDELADFLASQEITCLACCPTLLATIETDLPRLRILLVGGEACPHNLVERWYRDGRKILNSYGPTEATVTATLTELVPNKPVTIGVPLPTYSIVILDPATDQVAPWGVLGEIGIAGIGLAAGYMNRHELTQRKFIADFLGIPGNPSGRIYRTGDLGRINEEGEIEYHGRIDTQVKIRGYRIELIEIEQVLLGLPEIAQAAVTTFEPEPGQPELAAYYAFKHGAPRLARGDIAQALRSRLPAYMVPAYLEELPFIPMTISNKADHRQLPKPKSGRCSNGRDVVAPKNESERVLARALAGVLKVDAVSTEDDFFDDLGTNSLVMAKFCARIRRHPGMTNVSMRDIYLNPTIAALAAHLREDAGEAVVIAAPEPYHEASNLAYYGCGALQLMFYAVCSLLGLWFFDAGLEWVYAGIDDPISVYLRSVGFAAVSFLVLTAVPIIVKWTLIGRWKAESIPIWSLRYFRFWVVKTLVRTAPVAMFSGGPVYNVYLRLLGARIGANTVLDCQVLPVCSDLISVGDNTILRKYTMALGYKAQSNFIHTGPITIGNNAFVGEASVLDIDTHMGDDTQLGHASTLLSGQRVPDGKRYHGSPAVETASDYCPIEPMPSSAVRRGLVGTLQIAGIVTLAVPLPIVLLAYWEQYSAALTGSAELGSLLSGLALFSAFTFFGSLAAALAAAYVVPRLCRPFLETGKTYSLYGFHFGLQMLVSRFSNARIFNILFGDSSAIVHYMRYLGWNLNEVEQTGSNFGTNQQHDNPLLCEIGSGTMVSDGLSMINIHQSSSSFRLEHTRIGDHNYLGNDIHYPPDGRTGANVLLGTKVMIPIDGPVRENVGLLGSPCFEIPRMVSRDKDMIGAIDETTRRRLLGQKNKYNLVTGLLFLFSQWLFFFATLAVWQVAFLYYPSYGVHALFGAAAAMSVAAILYYALLERASAGFRRLSPKLVTIYDPYFWSHERHWKLSDSPIVKLFPGTPFRSLVWRLVGVRIGRKVFDGGCTITDRSMVEIGDGANLNERCVLQAHSLEEGVFKSDIVRIGAGCTLGTNAFAHYGITMGEHSVLEADAFLMKGETVDAYTVWRGNPAKLHRRFRTAETEVADAEACAPVAELQDLMVQKEAAE
ncbi:MAG: amino acid adenylation domain-containing protein [Hyphomicrobiales bacterium]|nr:amino acid adenylation domain-containing protein [Hyphomicrobiales bacterium]